MDDYRVNTKNHSINLRESYPENIESYQLNKKERRIVITYFNGEKCEMPLTDENVKKLDGLQKTQLENMKTAFAEHNNSFENKDIIYMYSSTTTLAGIGAAIIGLTSLPPIFGLGLVVLSSLGIKEGLSVASIRYKLVKREKEIKLASFLSENREEATEIIREEVDKLRQVDNRYQNLVLAFPENSPYSRNLYEQGLNLSTIDDLSIKQQRKLKRVIKKKKH